MKKIKLLLLSLLIVMCSQAQYVFKLSGGSYDIDSWVIISDDTAFARMMVATKMAGITTADFDCRAKTFWVNGEEPIVWFSREPNNIEDIAIVSHELFHLTVAYMNWAGIKLSDDSDEAYAHQLQCLTNQFYNNLNDARHLKNDHKD